MSLGVPNGHGLLAVCVSVRDQTGDTSEVLFCASVLQAVEHAIERLAGREDLTAVVVVGEDATPSDVQKSLNQRAAGLARTINQPGLFLTLAAQDIVRDRLMTDARFEDFGIFGTDELERAERVFAVFHPDLIEPTLPQKMVSGNCPRLHKSFVGRHRERDELQDLILQRNLVTVIGPPGVGKSMTAIHVARSFDDEYEDGVWWFSVDDRGSLDELLRAICTTRGLLSLKGNLSVERVAEALSGKRCVIILDGCESMANDIASFATAVLSHSRSLTLLLTSTRPIGIQDEFIYRLKPMTLPPITESGEDALIGSDALTLLYERANQAGVRLPLDDKTIELAGAICERVDGLPVAIELVAGSLRTTSLRQISKDLAQDLGELFKRSYGLDSALELSYALLSPDHQKLLQRVALFRGEWKVETAAELWKLDLPLEALEDVHRELVESSWLAFVPDNEAYRMLHTVRSFSWASAGADSDAIMARFCDGMTEIAVSICSNLAGQNAGTAEEALTRHYSDLVFALETSIGHAELSQTSTLLMQQMVHIWLRRNLLDDAETMSYRYLGTGVTGMEKARALVMIGVVNLRRRKLDAAISAFSACLAITRDAGSQYGEAAALTNLGTAHMEQGDYAAARRFCHQALHLYRMLKSPMLFSTFMMAADVETRSALLPTITAEERGSYLEQASRFLEEAEQVSDGNALTRQALYSGQGSLALAAHQLESAEALFYKAIAVCSKFGLRHEAGQALEGLVEINLKKGLGATAAKLLGLAMQIRKESGRSHTELETERYGRLSSELFRQVDKDRAEKLMLYGEKLDLSEILSPVIFNI